MAGQPGVQVKGAAELRRAVTKMGASTKDLTEVNQKAADIVAVEGRLTAPRLSGTLSRSVKAKARKTSGRVEAGRNRIVPYAGPIHFGWRSRNIEPQPFLYDALDRRRDQVIDQYEDRMTDLVLRLDRETPG